MTGRFTPLAYRRRYDAGMESDAHATAARGDVEFIFATPPGWIDLSNDDQAAVAPVVALRQSYAGDTQACYYAVDGSPARAEIDVRVGGGKMKIVPNSADRLRFSVPSALGLSCVGAEIVTLSATQAVRLDLEGAGLRHTWYYVPGRLRTALICCRCPRDQLAAYAPLFEAFATAAAHGAETAPETWGEVEERRRADPRRSLFGFKMLAWTLLGVAIAAAVGTPLNLNLDLTLIVGVLLGLVLAMIWAMRGGAPMLPGGDGESDD